MPIGKKVSKAIRANQPPAKLSQDPHTARRQLGSLHDYSKSRGLQGSRPGFQPVFGLETDEGKLGDVEIGKTTGEDYLKANYGDDNWQKIAESLLRNDSHIAISHDYIPGFGHTNVRMTGQERIDRLQRPAYTVMHDANLGGNVAFADPAFDSIYLNPNHLQVLAPGTPLRSVADHEMGHQMNPVLGTIRNVQTVGALDAPDYGLRAFDEADEAMRAGKIPNIDALTSAVGRTPYFGRVTEMAANMSAAKSRYYGLTGHLPLTPEDHDEMFRFMEQDPIWPTETKHSPAMFSNSFEPDPVMQYGPKAGQPASGWNDLKFQFQQLLKRALMEERQSLLEFGPYIASNQGDTHARAS